MTVTPHARLSETELAKAICQHYQENRLIPIGIGLSAVEQVAGKMAFGLRKVVSRFRRRWKESPDAAKLKGLTTLKQRLKERGITPESVPSADSQSCSQDVAAERVEQLGNELPSPASLDDKHKGSAVDWVALALKMKAHKEKMADKTALPGATLPAVQTPRVMACPDGSKPVATPARNKHLLPEFVVQTLKDAPDLPPFETKTAEDDAEPGTAVKQPAAKKKSRKGKKKEKKSKKALVAGPEEEANLALLPGAQEAVPAPADNPGVSALESSEPVYQPGEFNKKRLAFIARLRAEENMSFRDASAAWMKSTDRSNLLSSMPISELKKRRFM